MLLAMLAAGLFGHRGEARAQMPGPVSASVLDVHDRLLYRRAFAQADQGHWGDALALAAGAHNKLPAKVILWMALPQPAFGADFRTIADFVAANPGWPELVRLRRQAENVMPANLAPAQVAAWFQANPPLSPIGATRDADALMALGKAQAATQLVRRYWVNGAFGAVEEADYRRHFGPLIRPADDDARLDRLLWAGYDTTARRLLPFVDPGHRLLAEARLALAGMAADAQSAVARVPPRLRDDPGLRFAELRYDQREGRDAAAMAILDHPPARLDHPEAWWNERDAVARLKLQAGDYADAYRLVVAHGVLNQYELPEAEWLAGWIALSFLHRPGDALNHFLAMYKLADEPGSRSRAAYWSGRAAQAMGHTAAAANWYHTAAAFDSTFYGQLAAQQLGQNPRIVLSPEPPLPPGALIRFTRRETVQATRLLHQVDTDLDRTAPFLRRLGADAHSALDFALLVHLSLEVGHKDLAMIFARRGLGAGVMLADVSYPLLPAGEDPPGGVDPALVSAVVRQESAFNPGAVSTAGARGLMQLLPSTAQNVALKLGLSPSVTRLTADPAYNLTVGSAYLSSLIQRFNGSYLLAVAAYNAGPARVRSWIDMFGDPRTGKISPVDWIEMIPFNETRAYVQRVLEGYEVYRARLSSGIGRITLAEDLKR